MQDGRANAEVLRRFFSLENMMLLKPFMGIAIFRDRLLADNTFMNKVSSTFGTSTLDTASTIDMQTQRALVTV